MTTAVRARRVDRFVWLRSAVVLAAVRARPRGSFHEDAQQASNSSVAGLRARPAGRASAASALRPSSGAKSITRRSIATLV